MSGFINEYGLPMEDIDCLVPVPLHPTRLREREFNQALLLGRHIAEDFGKDMFGDAMVREKHTKTQTGLQFAERIANLSGSFKVTEPQAIKGKNVLLIDDVLTTGSTSSEAAAALKAAGAKIVFVLTLAS
jgi:ComF family protein